MQALHSPNQTDEAYNDLLEMGKRDKGTVVYLASELAPIITKGPELPSWENAVRLAGLLQIAETCEALAKWVGYENSQEYTNSQIFQLNLNPAAKTLSQIGDGSVPALTSVLKKGNEKDRYYAVLTLDKIHSPAAIAALSDHVASESDPVTKEIMQKAIAR
jgi:hypothetical protein